MVCKEEGRFIDRKKVKININVYEVKSMSNFLTGGEINIITSFMSKHDEGGMF